MIEVIALPATPVVVESNEPRRIASFGARRLVRTRSETGAISLRPRVTPVTIHFMGFRKRRVDDRGTEGGRHRRLEQQLGTPKIENDGVLVADEDLID
jgi:hypothetical protein